MNVLRERLSGYFYNDDFLMQEMEAIAGEIAEKAKLEEEKAEKKKQVSC